MGRRRRRIGRAIAGALVTLAVAGSPPPARSADIALAALEGTLRTRYPAIRAVLVTRRDCRIFTFYKAGVDPGTRLPVYSVTKSVLSILLGLLVGRGDLDLGGTLGALLPEALDPAIDRRVRAITVRQLMTMTAGFDAEEKPKTVPPPGGWRWALGRRILSAPGRAFRYDNQNANLLSVILSRRTGQSAEAFARTTLFGPLGIRSSTWADDGEGHSTGASGLWLTAPDMAKIGELVLHGGAWRGRRIVPDAALAEAVRVHNPGGTPFRTAYGYLWWVRPGRTGTDAIFAAGSGGQLIYVVPRSGLVAVLASETAPPGGAVRFMTEVVLPAATKAAASCPGGAGPDP